MVHVKETERANEHDGGHGHERLCSHLGQLS